MFVLSSFSHVWLFVTLLQTCSQPGSSVQGILQTRILEWVAMPSSGVSSPLRDQTHVFYVSCIGSQVLYHYHHPGSPHRGMGHPNVMQFQSAEFIFLNFLTYICIICLYVDFLVSSPDFIDDDTEYLRGEFLIYNHN